MKKIIIPRPADLHVHLRELPMLKDVVPASNLCAWVTAMANLIEPIDSASGLAWYKGEICSHKPKFKPIMVVMLTRDMTPERLEECFKAGARVLKWIPDGASVNSSNGVTLFEIKKYRDVFLKAYELRMITSLHLELIEDEFGVKIPESKREERAIPFLFELHYMVPNLKIVVEHLTTKAMVTVVKMLPNNVAATITPQHLVLTMDEVISREGKRGLNYSKPIAKTGEDRNALIRAAISGDSKFFFGSDSAPHYFCFKLLSDPSAGIFVPTEISLAILAEFFYLSSQLDNLIKFTSENGQKFYGLEPSSETILIEKKTWTPPAMHNDIPVFMGGNELNWKVDDERCIF